jgi:hypothetical protein
MKYLGRSGRCLVTGFIGTVDQVCWPRAGVVRVSLQAKFQEGAKDYPPSFYFDYPQVELGESVIDTQVNDEAPEFKFDFNDVVIEKASGFKGTVVSKILHLNGCKGYSVVMNKDDAKEHNKDKESLVTRFQVLEGELHLIEAAQKVKYKVEVNTGGPVERSYRPY